MEQSSWQVNSHSVSREIPSLLWNQNVHCRVHKNPPLYGLDRVYVTLHPEHGGSKVLWKLLSCSTTWRHNPEGYDL